MAPSPTRFTLSREKHSETGIDYLYDNEDSVCGLIHDNTPYYFKKNLQGDVIQIIDSVGNPVANYSYDAWGVCTIISDSTATDEFSGIATINPFRYRSYFYDKEFSIYYLVSRYYTPIIGRFLTIDVRFDSCSPETLPSLYSYCANAPSNYYDEDGTVYQDFKSLPSKGFIHNKVVKYICLTNPNCYHEINITTKRADIIRIVMDEEAELYREIYEVKPISYLIPYKMSKAKNQLGNYVDLAPQHKQDPAIIYKQGTWVFAGAFQSEGYNIEYTTIDGIIFYSFEKLSKPQKAPDYYINIGKDTEYAKNRKDKFKFDAPPVIDMTPYINRKNGQESTKKAADGLAAITVLLAITVCAGGLLGTTMKCFGYDPLILN